jgi:hypothetical protein
LRDEAVCAKDSKHLVEIALATRVNSWNHLIYLAISVAVCALGPFGSGVVDHE